MKKALITGITGQDGSYLAELLISKGYEVYGIVRRLSTKNYSNIENILDQLIIIDGDLTDSHSIYTAIGEIQPDEVYNLAAQSFVGTSWTQPELTGNVNALGTIRILEALHSLYPDTRFYQASTSEMFGNTKIVPQNEDTIFRPRSPYGISKLYAHWATINYRESYDMFCCCGILFNHESERRGTEFVTQKIAQGVAQIHNGNYKKIPLGNIDSKRDWGYAPDYVDAMYRILHHKTPEDFVVATGIQYSIRDFLQEAFNYIGVENYEKYIEVDPKLFRPAEVDTLMGDSSRIRKSLKWEPKTLFKELVVKMVESAISKVN